MHDDVSRASDRYDPLERRNCGYVCELVEDEVHRSRQLGSIDAVCLAAVERDRLMDGHGSKEVEGVILVVDEEEHGLPSAGIA